MCYQSAAPKGDRRKPEGQQMLQACCRRQFTPCLLLPPYMYVDLLFAIAVEAAVGIFFGDSSVLTFASMTTQWWAF